MNWKELLLKQIDEAYRVSERLVGLLDESDLSWKPSENNNWMTTGQLLYHLGHSCGIPMKGFATGEWNMPAHDNVSETKPDIAPPPAEKLKTVESLGEAMKMLAEDKKIAIESVNGCVEEDLDGKPSPAPWDRTPLILGLRLLQMIDHLNQHKAQLFYYLKLQGKPVNTMHLYA
ncbi:MAG: DinB family protein [Chlorobiaceae bacterium]|nr:DinB family protein [Chlorobiaceae bacterium]NTV61631.1 DinB family protein [Chlorobiaceae bacterium]